VRGGIALPAAAALLSGLLFWTPVCAQAPRASPSPRPIVVAGQFLTLDHGFLVFTTGDALNVDPALHAPPDLRLGSEIRATLDPASHRVETLDVSHSWPGDVAIEKLPRDYLAVDPRSARPGASPPGAAGTTAALATVTIDVRVPGSTPAGDTVYVSTDRSSFAPSEVRMLRVDASHWTARLSLPNGSTLRYAFTRGSLATLERSRSGAVVKPRSIVASDGEQTDDEVERWIDSQ
jgi:hypothetical protein